MPGSGAYRGRSSVTAERSVPGRVSEAGGRPPRATRRAGPRHPPARPRHRATRAGGRLLSSRVHRHECPPSWPFRESRCWLRPYFKVYRESCGNSARRSRRWGLDDEGALSAEPAPARHARRSGFASGDVGPIHWSVRSIPRPRFLGPVAIASSSLLLPPTTSGSSSPSGRFAAHRLRPASTSRSRSDETARRCPSPLAIVTRPRAAFCP